MRQNLHTAFRILRLHSLGVIFFIGSLLPCSAAKLLIPMNKMQSEHLKAYGIAYIAVQNGLPVWWLLNYEGGSFMCEHVPSIEELCRLRNVDFDLISDARSNALLASIASPAVNQDAIKLEKAPKIAVYAPSTTQPWDDAVLMALTYAEIPFTQIYDNEILEGKLKEYDWLHLHHEDFTGQYGKFWYNYKHMGWYKKQVSDNEKQAKKWGYNKVSKMKLAIALRMKKFVGDGGFLFAMCSACDSYDIALAAQRTDICDTPFDYDPPAPDAQHQLDFTETFAFENFQLNLSPAIYEYSNIDVTLTRKITKERDYFTLFDFSAKWDPVPSMLCQNHQSLIKGFMGQTTAFNKKVIKSGILIMGENKEGEEARYIHGKYKKGQWTFLGGHDPEDYEHFVGDPPTDLKLHPNSPSYRLILNNILFPAAKKKKQKT